MVCRFKNGGNFHVAGCPMKALEAFRSDSIRHFYVNFFYYCASDFRGIG